MDKALQRKQTKERVKRYRERQNVTQSPDSVTESVDSVTQYHPIVYALTDPIKRQKLERICESLKRHNVLDKVYYGCGRHSIPFDEVGELLETTA